MTAPLLATKLYIPPPRPDLVPRPHLIQQLNTGLSRKLTLLSAPAGFGKSTVLSAWVGQVETNTRIAWLALDESDNDLERFLTYFIAALQTIKNDIGQGVLTAQQLPGTANIEAVLTNLINEITEFSEDVVLILDDFHVIESKSISQALTFLLDYLPANFHLFFATRVDPPLPLARLRARGQVTELRTANLRFTNDEAGRFLNQVMGLGLSGEDVAALETRTEGWIVGLQLAALSLQEKEDATDFIRSFTGSHHHILDYLVEEVLSGQPPDTQSFLLQTSILERLTGPLCDVVCAYNLDDTDTNNGQAILEHLAMSNLFIVPLDDERQWYRYHHLFADLLQARLKRFHSKRMEDLHARASRWFDEHGLPNQAIKHALEIDDKKIAADLLERHSKTFLFKGEAQVHNMVGWFKQFSQKEFKERPLLHIYYAWTLVFENPFENSKLVEQILTNIQETLEKTDIEKIINKTITGHIASIQGFLSQPPIKTDHDPDIVLALLKKAQTLLPVSETEIRSDNSINIGYEYMHLEDTKAALKANQDAYTEAQPGGNRLVATVSIRNQAWINYCLGELEQAVEICQKSLSSFDLLYTDKDQPFPGTGILFIMLGYLFIERGELEKAENELSKGFDLLRWFGEYEALTMGLIALTRLLLLKGGDVRELQVGEQYERHWSSCEDLVKTLRIMVALSRLEDDNSSVEIVLTWLREHQPRFDNDLQGISPWAETQHIAYFTWIQAHLTLSRLEIESLDKPVLQSCLDYLDRQLQNAEQRELIFRVIECFTTKALILDALGEYSRASVCLIQVLEIAETQGHIRPFLDKGRPMADLLRESAKSGIAPTYASKLLSIFDVQDSSDLTASPAKAREQGRVKSDVPINSPPMEPLTDRELEVLKLMAEGFTYNEIAAQIMVSLNTVRTHIKNIYSKLYVHKRSQAIAKAKELNIL